MPLFPTKTERPHPHGPENAEHELKKAYDCVIEIGLAYHHREGGPVSPNAQEVTELYRHAFNSFRRGRLLAAERWARTVKHLARAFWQEAKIAYLEPRVTDVPFLREAYEEYGGSGLSIDQTQDLLNSVSFDVPPGQTEMPEPMSRFLKRAGEHLTTVRRADYSNELLRTARTLAAHEYARVLECMALAYEAEHLHEQEEAGQKKTA